jgi:hypothetical protein
MYCTNFEEAINHAKFQLDRYGAPVNPGTWQGFDTKGKPDLVTQELMNLTLEVPMNRPGYFTWDNHVEFLVKELKPNLPWADEHFAERVSRDPTNPGEAYKNWPWWQGQEAAAMVGELDVEAPLVFTHTYQERFWPKRANMGNRPHAHNRVPIWGIRYQWGDLDDVVRLLLREPLTRQATFPIFFPEDTGSVHQGRVPCTLHYHFLMRNKMLNMWYPIRSCDYVRHFRDDLYLAGRLLLWVLSQLRYLDPETWEEVTPGMLYFTAYSFHMHAGDAHHVE